MYKFQVIVADFSYRVDNVFTVMFIRSRIICSWVIIPVTWRLKGYNRFVGKYEIGRRKHFRPYK